ncbi:4Fe-4S dicluster domain-containing protein [Chloroflexota bacterium]
MTQLALVVDEERCVGCRSCEVACKSENNLPVGSQWMKVDMTIKEVGGKLVASFPHRRCRHCAKPSCIDICPTNAITKRADGVVLINPELCNGCMACVEACSFGAPQFNPERNIMEMCTLCVHRIDKGLEPACVIHCPAGDLIFGEINHCNEVLQEHHERRMAGRIEL